MLQIDPKSKILVKDTLAGSMFADSSWLRLLIEGWSLLRATDTNFNLDRNWSLQLLVLIIVSIIRSTKGRDLNNSL